VAVRRRLILPEDACVAMTALFYACNVNTFFYLIYWVFDSFWFFFS
jgi:hypothetical protein